MPVIRFRATEREADAIQSAASERGQTVSAVARAATCAAVGIEPDNHEPTFCDAEKAKKARAKRGKKRKAKVRRG